MMEVQDKQARQSFAGSDVGEQRLGEHPDRSKGQTGSVAWVAIATFVAGVFGIYRRSHRRAFQREIYRALQQAPAIDVSPAQRLFVRTDSVVPTRKLLRDYFTVRYGLVAQKPVLPSIALIERSPDDIFRTEYAKHESQTDYVYTFDSSSDVAQAIERFLQIAARTYQAASVQPSALKR